MRLVAGIDSSTQSCKVIIRDAESGALVRTGRAAHPDGTEVDPARWWDALQAAVADAGGLADIAALAVGGQQHGMIALDADGAVVRDALLWNDTRSAAAALDLVDELGADDRDVGATAWAQAIGSVPVASLTVAKLRWLRDAEPANAARVAAVALPHDWLTWRLAGHGPGSGAAGLAALTTDRSDASGTGYWSPFTDDYRTDLLELALGHGAVLPRVVGAGAQAGTAHDGRVPPGAPPARTAPPGAVLGAGAGDNAAAALGLGMVEGDVAISIGTSGVVSAVSATPTADPSGLVTGFADATGAFLPLACTLNASRVLDAAARMLGVDHGGLSALALSAPAAADGLVLVPYLEGERTPNKPHATGALHGLRLANTTPAHLARAAVEGMLCALADGLDALRGQGVPVRRVFLIGGGAQSEAVRRIAPAVIGLDVAVPTPGEYVADGAARQAAWALAGDARPPAWALSSDVEIYSAEPTPRVRAQYAAVRELTGTCPT